MLLTQNSGLITAVRILPPSLGILAGITSNGAEEISHSRQKCVLFLLASLNLRAGGGEVSGELKVSLRGCSWGSPAPNTVDFSFPWNESALPLSVVSLSHTCMPTYIDTHLTQSESERWLRAGGGLALMTLWCQTLCQTSQPISHWWWAS